MAHHRAAPHPAGVELGVIGFRTDGGRVEQHLGALERHHPRAFGVPLVPADPDADGRTPAGAGHLPDLEAVIAGAEVIFFLVAGPVGDVALAIGPHDRAIGADHRQRVVIVMAIALEEAGRDRDAMFCRQFLHRQHRGVRCGGPCAGEQRLVLLAAEIFAGEELGRKNHLRALTRRLRHQRRDRSDVARLVRIGEWQLKDGEAECAHRQRLFRSAGEVHRLRNRRCHGEGP